MNRMIASGGLQGYLQPVVQIKDALMYSHQQNKSASAVADD